MTKKKGKMRLDLLLVEKNLISTRSKAKAEIMAGNVYVNGVKRDKPGETVLCRAEVEVRGTLNPYVSRGGLKLEKPLREFNIDLEGRIVLDIGASTGGFTHCALKQGAKKVYALDVGYGQLAWKLRREPRVINMERFNVRHLKKEDLPDTPDLAVIDVSFISLKLVLPVVAALGIPEIICLIKPQFEAKPVQVGKRGVVRDAAVHHAVLKGIAIAAEKLAYRVAGLTYSPLKGPRGNIEFFLYLRQKAAMGLRENGAEDLSALIQGVVSQAHSHLG